MPRTEHMWQLRPPPGTRFSLFQVDGKPTIRLDYGPAKFAEVPNPPDGVRYMIRTSDLELYVPYGREYETIDVFKDWAETLSEERLKEYLRVWIVAYLEPQARRFVDAKMAAEAVTKDASPQAKKASQGKLLSASSNVKTESGSNASITEEKQENNHGKREDDH
jgi:hypothetical protein